MPELSQIVADEFAGVSFEDKRLSTRLRTSAAALARNPAAGLPRILTDAELEGFYRFVNNTKVDFKSIFEAHVAATKGRAANAQRVIVAHDTTDFRFSDETKREGLGVMDNGGQGFYAHFSMATTAQRVPLGVVAVETWTRVARDGDKPSQRERYCADDKESLRWMRGVRQAEFELYGMETKLVHVMDREADDFDILCEMVERKFDFVIRASVDRCLAAEHEGRKLKAVARDLEVQVIRDAQLSNRKRNRPAKQRKRFPPRKARVASLEICCETVTLRRPNKASRALPAELALNVVYVKEPNPSAGLRTCGVDLTDESTCR